MSKSESNRLAEQSESPGFLSRWSKRKASTADKSNSVPVDIAETDDELSPGLSSSDNLGLEDAELPAVVERESESSNDVGLESTDEIVLTDADMPPIESLDSKSDVSMFLNKGVSETLRKAAFRRLFSLPAYNIRDGLNDYDEDYTYFEPLGDTITSDMKFHAARKERERLAKEAELAEAQEAEQQAVSEDSETEPEEQQGEEQMQPDEPVATDNELMADSGDDSVSSDIDSEREEIASAVSTDGSDMDRELTELDSHKPTTTKI